MTDKATPARRIDRISHVTRQLADRPLLTELGLLAVTVLFGLQALRVLVPGAVWLLGDRMGLGPLQAGGLTLLIFLSAFLAGPLQRLLSTRLWMVITASGLGLLRLCMQIWSSQPLVELSLAMVGTALFILFLPTYLRYVGARSRLGIGQLGLGLLLGLILDTALHGAFATYDISWQPGLPLVLLVLFLVLIQWILLAGVALAREVDSARTLGSTTHGVPVLKLLTWLAVGPFLFLELLIFQNIAQLTVLTGWPLPWAFGWTLLAQLLGLAAAAWLVSRRHQTVWPLALFSGVGLVVILVLPHQQGAVITALLFLLGQVLLSLLIVLVFIGIGVNTQKIGSSSIILANGLGMILLLLFILGYYAVYNISLPYSNTIIEPIAASIVAICALGASTSLRRRTMATHGVWLAPALALLLLIPPLVGAITWRAPTAVPGEGFPVRVMTYNLHNGFDTEANLDMEGIAQVIEDNHPDIVALQEVSRGWVISGRLDMLTWLSQRLGLPYVFGPTADPYWGNAILSRYPIVEYTFYELPPHNLFIRRGFIVALIDLGHGDHLQVIATHFHHLEEDSDIRQLQSEAVIDFWDSAERTVLMGDLNAQPDDPETEMLRQAGLVDAMAGIEPPAYTYPSVNPDRRIDYIWISSDLRINNAWVPVSNASDHLPVVAEINR